MTSYYTNVLEHRLSQGKRVITIEFWDNKKSCQGKNPVTSDINLVKNHEVLKI